MLGEGYYLVGQHLVHDRTRSAKNTFIEDDASDSDYDYDISTESEERD